MLDCEGRGLTHNVAGIPLESFCQAISSKLNQGSLLINSTLHEAQI
jgi:hypothetical protein